MTTLSENIYTFWFSLNMKQWFDGNDKKLDKFIFDNYYHHIINAQNKKLHHWKNNPKSLLSLILLLDQFPRHIYRGDSKAYTHSSYAIQLAHYGFKHYLQCYNATEIMFLLLPFQHSESLIQQKNGIRYHYTVLKKKNFKCIQELKIINLALYHQIQHFEVIQKFGRFPKRNKSLGRESTNYEKQYLNSKVIKKRNY